MYRHLYVQKRSSPLNTLLHVDRCVGIFIDQVFALVTTLAHLYAS